MRIRLDGKVQDRRALWLEGDKVRMIDQRLLPHQIKLLDIYNCEDMAEAIRNMTVRGAPAIGAAAAYGMLLAKNQGMDLQEAARLLRSTRPTAHDLFFAVDFMIDSMAKGEDAREAADRYADTIVERCRLIGEHGEGLIANGARVMTHCNAGALATLDHGTALAPIRAAWRKGKPLFVYVSETRPRWQGMKLTAFEMVEEGIPHAIIPDGAAGHFLRLGTDVVIVGADRIAANGDFANKIGTFEKAVLAHELGVPFYTAAPISTFDLRMESGKDIPIENRSPTEVTEVDGHLIAPKGSAALNPSFDVTPHKYVTGIITEIGVIRPSEVHKVKGALMS